MSVVCFPELLAVGLYCCYVSVSVSCGDYWSVVIHNVQVGVCFPEVLATVSAAVTSLSPCLGDKMQVCVLS